jgi:hypothetical protein
LPSSYFSEPSEGLDPDLFDGDLMREEVRTGLLNILYSDLEQDVGFKEPWNWVCAWLAGSAASYQWSADRGNGDLDVLFGVDFPGFLEDNPQFPRLSEREVAEYTDKILRAKSWPKTRHVTIGGSKKHYEITFFWNPGMGTDIRTIHAYAAYDLIMDRWDVDPPRLPKDPHSLYPSQWYEFTERDFANVWTIQDLYHSGGPSGKIQGANAARALWRDIHEGRRQAFSDTGAGYADFHNFRWQRAKETGAVDVLRGILATDPEPQESPQDLITRAALRYASPKYYV